MAARPSGDDGPVPTHDELVARARALRASMRERAVRAERDRRIPRESIENILNAGLVQILVPRRWGGYGADLDTWLDVSVEISRGCAATGWVTSLFIHYGFVVSMFPEQAQQEIWKECPHVLLAASLTPVGRAETNGDGYRVTGEFPYASGVDHASWVIVCSPIQTDGSPPELRLFLLRPSEYTVRDTWFSIGLRGTGSNTVIVDDVLVPEERTIRLRDKIEGTTAGGVVNGGAYRLPMSAYNGITFLGPMLGAAQGALESYLVRTRQPRSTSASGPTIDRAHAHLALGRITAKLDTAELLIRRGLRSARQYTPRSDGAVSRARSSRDWAHSASLITEAVDELLQHSGTSAQTQEHPIQRAWRDVHAGASHFALDYARNVSAFGKALLEENWLPP